MIAHFGELTGVPYPWNKYAQVVVSDFIFGGMENTTATTMYEHILLDERAAHRRHSATTSSRTSSRTSGSATT